MQTKHRIKKRIPLARYRSPRELQDDEDDRIQNAVEGKWAVKAEDVGLGHPV